MRSFFFLFLLAAAGCKNTAVAGTTGDDAEQHERRNILVRGGGAAPGTGADGKNSGTPEGLQEEDSLRRKLAPAEMKQDTSFQCAAKNPDPYGCPAGKQGICYYHTGGKSSSSPHYHTKCVYTSEVTAAGGKVGDALSSDKFIAACAPCGCSSAFIGQSVKVGASAVGLVCPDSCLACDGAPTFLYNGARMPFASHNAFAQAMGCQMASIHSLAEQAAAEAVLQPLPNQDYPSWVFIGLKKQSCTSTTCTFEWTDGTGTFTSNRHPNNNDLSDNSNVYTKWWPATEPNSDIEEPYAAILTFPAARNYWGDVPPEGGNFPALYKCCERPPINFDGCTVGL